MDKTLKALAHAYQEVTEGRFVIPEEVPANERTAFHGAAAAAHKSGKSHFTFGGKKYPVTMKKDTAHAIADDVKENVENKMMHNDNVVLKSKKKKKGEDDPQGNNGETATMNPKAEDKSTTENVKSADKKPEVYVGPDGKKHTRMVPVDKEVVTRESTDMSIREKLLSVLEKKENHSPNQDKAEKPEDALKGAGAKQMKADIEGNAADPDLEKKSHDDASKAGRVTKQSAPNPTDKAAPGDKNVINPVQDTTKVGKGSPEVKESFSKTVKSIGNAYKSMYATESTVSYHDGEYEKHDDHADKAKSEGDHELAAHHEVAAEAHKRAAEAIASGRKNAGSLTQNAREKSAKAMELHKKAYGS